MRGGIEYNPTVVLRADPRCRSARSSRRRRPGSRALDTSIAYNRDFGLPAIVNLTFGLGGEHVEAIKRVVYWPRLDPAQQPNKNPTMGGIRLYRHRDDATGNPIDEIDPVTDPMPTVSVSAMDKLYVQPIWSLGTTVEENYLLKVNNIQADQIETRVIERELVRFFFYASPAGTFDPLIQFSEENPVTDGVPRRQRVRAARSPTRSPPTASVTLWIVAHDERAGTDWVSRTINVVP